MKFPESAKEFFAAAGKRGGKAGGAKGGLAAAANMTPEQRVARARKAGLARKVKPK